MGNLMKKLTNWIPLLILQIAASSAFTYFVMQSGMIPTKYLIGLIAAEVLLAIGMFFLMKPSKKIGRHAAESSLKTMIGKIVSLMVSLSLCFGSSVASKGGSTISKITNGVLKQVTYSVYVLKKSNINKATDLKDLIVGCVPTITPETYMTASTKLNEEVAHKQRKYDKLEKMAHSLIKNKIHAIIINEDYVSTLQKSEPTWDNDTKKIWSYTVTNNDESAKIDVTTTPFTMYLCGVDSRGGVTDESRADVNMILTINPKTHQILMTSIPRDMFVTIHGIGEKDKLTHAATLGTPTAAASIEDFMGIKINFYSRVGFTMLQKLVDGLGGVRVYSDKAFIPWTNSKVYIKKGWQTMNGKQALAFARERKTYGEGDRHRAANQQAVIKAIVEKMTTASGLANYDKLLDAVAGTFQTTITASQLKDLINMQLDKMPKWTFQSSVLNGEGIITTGGYFMPDSKLWYLMPDEASTKKNAKYINDMLAGKKVTVDKDSSLESEIGEHNSTESSSSSTSSSTTSRSTTRSTRRSTTRSTIRRSTSRTRSSTRSSTRSTTGTSRSTTGSSKTSRSTTGSSSTTSRSTTGTTRSSSRSTTSRSTSGTSTTKRSTTSTEQ